MKAAVLFSGGKDSCMALYWALKNAEVACLVNMISEKKDSYMFHVPNVEWVKLQAKAVNIPLLTGKTKGEKETELADLKKTLENAMKKHKIEALVAGALASNYQRERVEKICKELGLEVFVPYWETDPETYMKEVIEIGFESVLTAVAAEGLTMEFLGKTIDSQMLDRLIEIKKKLHININGEGGEYETFVINGPMFKKRVIITDAEIHMEKRFS
ncbi:MAG: diphthine--ammonia ligase, partial [bacterium]|nr:diphthine--ammonia ligase [bacterium]